MITINITLRFRKNRFARTRVLVRDKRELA
jgi:hypothetical protein